MSLYPPPRDLATQVFTELPAEFRQHDCRSDWVEANKPGPT
jgi:hypothetical protein